VGTLPQTRSPSPGCGESVHAQTDGYTLGAITHASGIFHVVAAAA
jgi:hypothetical protein